MGQHEYGSKNGKLSFTSKAPRSLTPLTVSALLIPSFVHHGRADRQCKLLDGEWLELLDVGWCGGGGDFSSVIRSWSPNEVSPTRPRDVYRNNSVCVSSVCNRGTLSFCLTSGPLDPLAESFFVSFQDRFSLTPSLQRNECFRQRGYLLHASNRGPRCKASLCRTIITLTTQNPASRCPSFADLVS